MVGISIKLAVLPLHQWLPNAYTFAPPVVSAFLAATATKVAYYLMLRFTYTIFGAAFVFSSLRLNLILTPLSLAAMFIGSIAAIYRQQKLFILISIRHLFQKMLLLIYLLLVKLAKYSQH